MRILEGIEGLKAAPAGAVMSIGNFDGIHLGHQRILATAGQLAWAESPRHARGPVVVVTFEPHPLTVLRPQLAPPRLTPPAIKRSLLESAGVDCLVVLPPDPQVLNLSAEEFWQILRDQVRPAHLVEGANFTFGKRRGGTIERLIEWTAGTAVQLHVVSPVEAVLLDRTIAPVSSSLVRWLLSNGRVRDAAILLGRNYVLAGPVVRGFERGRTIGVPTANLDCGDQMIPAEGVYVGRCMVDSRPWPAAVSIGTMPTFGENRAQIEAHLIGFEGDLYGQSLRLELVDWVREQWKFDGVASLKRQMQKDIAYAVERQSLVQQPPPAPAPLAPVPA